jgi:hypothetical protein
MNSSTQELKYSRMQECCDANLDARLLVLLESLSTPLLITGLSATLSRAGPKDPAPVRPEQSESD